MKKIIFSLIILFNILLVFPQQDVTPKRISISNPSQSIIQKIKKAGIDLNCGPRFINNNLEIELGYDELKELQKNGISYTVLINDLTSYYSKRNAIELPMAKSKLSSLKTKNNKKSKTSNFSKSLSLQNVLVGNPTQHDECDEINWTVPANYQLGSMGGCLTVSETLAQLDLMRSLYPNLISVKTDASSTGQTTHGNSTGNNTWPGQTIYYVRISDNPDVDEATEPETLITGMTHAREVNSLMNVMYFMWYVLENYNSDPFIKNIVDNQELYFMPIMNPDGLRWNEVIAPNGGGLQRKNLRPGVADNGTTNTSNNVRGIDLNRNFNYYWGFDNSGSSPTASSNVYRGASAGSEPETQIVQDFVLNHDVKVGVNHHSGLNSIVTSSYNGNLNASDSGREDEYAKICHDLTQYNRYIYGSAPNTLTSANGDVNDWMLGGTPISSGGQTSSGSGKDVLAFAPENGDDFWPTPSEITPIAQRAMRINFLSILYSGKFAKLHDLNTSDINSTSGDLTFGVEYLGKTYDDITLTVVPVSSNITSITPPSIQTGWSKLEQRNLTVPYTLDASIQANDEIEFQVTLSNNDFVIYQANYVKYYQSNILFQDNPDVSGTSNWATSGGSWGTTADAYSGSAAITDSPSGSYSNNENKTITLNSVIDLSGTSQTLIQYYAKWDLERNYDLVQIEASTDGGSSWNALCGNYNKPAAAFDTNFHLNKNTNAFRNHQSNNGNIVYDGDTMDKWVMEEIYIDATENSFLLGQNNVQLRFRLKTDSTNREDDLTTTFDGFTFDDFRVIGIETPCASSIPTNLVSSNVTITDATIAWDNIPSATYDLRYRVVGAQNWTDVLGLTIPTTTLTGLEIITDYEVQVRSNCGANNSAYSALINFTSLDIPSGCSGGIASFPYTEGFEGSIGAWTQFSGDDLNWLVNSGGTPSNNTGPSSAVQGSDYIYVEASGNGSGFPNKRAIITSPCFDLSNATGGDFSFQYHMFGASNMGTIDLEISNDDGVSWVSIWNQSGNQGNSWFAVTLNLNAYVGGNIQVRFNRLVGNTWQADIAIDDISLITIEEDTTAPTITLIGTSTIDINVGGVYTEEGATATDDLDGDITSDIVIAGDIVDTNTGGTYLVTYDVSDASGNAATQVVRTVNVIPDTTAPTITLIGASTIDINVGGVYTEEGATATDDLDGDITSDIVIAGDIVDTNTGGTYLVTYDVSDASGNAATQVVRTVNVIPDTTAPTITLIGASTIDINVGGVYTEEGATATDDLDGDITSDIVIAGDIVDTNTGGTYLVTYDVSDASGNAATQVVRTVNVIPDTTAPTITLIGASTIDINVGGVYTEEGATATDDLDGDITSDIVIAGDIVDTNTGGTYLVTYDVSDASGNAATQALRTVNVIPDTTAPTITLVGASTIDINVGGVYTEEGATATDDLDGDITSDIVIAGDIVDTNTGGTYLVTYDVSDASGNAATQAVRTVNVIPDTTAPTITLIGASTIDINVGGVYTEEGATATDDLDGDITSDIVIAGDIVDTNTGGTYLVTYDVSDASGNAATQVVRTVNVIPDTTAPTITLIGASTIDINVGGVYTEEGATATDDLDGDITSDIVIAGDIVDTNTGGTYLVTYDVSDASGNAATQVVRTVNVIPDTTAPTITLIGASTIDINVGVVYTEEGATATDDLDGDITSDIVIAGDIVDTNAGGTYLVTYDVSDASGNAATQAVRTVNVIPDTTAPTITLIGASTIDINVGVVYTEEGATATDDLDGDITSDIVIAGDIVDTNTGGTYLVTYDVSDASGNVATQVVRTVNVNESSPNCSGGIASFPYNEGFENTLGAWTQSSSDDIDWTIDASGTPSGNTGPSNAIEGNFYVYVEASVNGTGFPDKRALLNSPCFDLTSLTEATFSFNYHMYGASDMGRIDLEITQDAGVTWTSIWNETGNKGNSWQTAIVDLSVYVGGGIQLRFNRFVGSTWQADIAIDNVSLVDEKITVPSCSGGITSYPYAESFENTLGLWTQSSADDINWTIDTNGTPSGNTGPASAVQGSFYIFVEASGNGTGFPNKSAIINSPCYDLSAVSSATFSFNYHMFGSNDMGTIALEVSNDNGISWTPIWTESGNKGNAWLSANIDLSVYTGNSVQLRFNRITGGTWQADIAIDNINLTVAVAAAKNESKENVLSVSKNSFNKLTLYPNPAENILNIKTAKGRNMSYRIINSLGQIVSYGKTYKTVDVDALEAGMYFIEVNDGSDKMIERFIKE